MRGFFDPKSVAVIGVSDRPHNLARAIVLNLLTFRYRGVIHLVGPRGGSFQGMPIHSSVQDIDGDVDLAVVLAPARTVPGIVDACGRKGIRRVVIESAGFGEKGGDGDPLQQALLEAARRHDIRFIGPNCLGTASSGSSLVTMFNPMPTIYHPGGVSLISQSGGVGIAYLSTMAHEGLGVARFASIGNKLDVDECDLLEFLLEDPLTEIVVMYLEGVDDGRRLLALLRGARKPVLVQKANRGGMSRDIAASHTASLASDDAVVDAALAQGGALRRDDGHALTLAAKAVSLAPLRGSNLAVISRSGGHAVQVADACEKHGFTLASFGPSVFELIQGRCRSGVVRLTNPLDLGDLFDFDTYVDLVRSALRQPDVDGVVFLHTYTGPMEQERSRRLVERLAELGRAASKPLAVVMVTDQAEQTWLREAYCYPLFTEPGDAVEALAIRRDVTGRIDAPAPEPPPRNLVDPSVVHAAIEGFEPAGPTVDLALALIADCGVPVVPGRLVHSAAAAVRAGRELGLPCVAKLASAAASHKTDVGGVRLGLSSLGELGRSVTELLDLRRSLAPAERGGGVLVQAQAPAGLDLIVGGRRDPQFGPVVVAGFGGILVEVMGQVAMRVAPIGPSEARAMLLGLQGAELFEGVRGQPAPDIDAAVDAILRIAALLEACPEIAEIDVNPFRLLPAGQGGLALDARVVLS